MVAIGKGNATVAFFYHAIAPSGFGDGGGAGDIVDVGLGVGTRVITGVCVGAGVDVLLPPLLLLPDPDVDSSAT